MPARVANNDSFGLGRIQVHLCLGAQVNLGRDGGQCDSAAWLGFRRLTFLGPLQSNDVGLPSARNLFGESVFGESVIVRREKATIQCPGNLAGELGWVRSLAARWRNS
jgi:hypothetical protein